MINCLSIKMNYNTFKFFMFNKISKQYKLFNSHSFIKYHPKLITFESNLNKLVYQLYDLTDDEIEIVEKEVGNNM